MAVLWDHETDSGHGAARKDDPQIEIGCAETLAVPHGRAQFTTARQPMTPL
jgi:hypothetical protein